ncbi:aminotransferase class V-fold PLP-dependent enzyme [Roseomonas sp. CAU 1739]|uniref:aminotransferase class V-fold PLP-dependent enzyme n=1 Tax=Roseomonas sp. CAU 1739 TaxID=3140364 RepID=UPI00325A6E2A
MSGWLGARRIINAYGTNTRLSGGMMAPRVIEAMAAAANGCVEMHDIQAAASRAISEVTGAEAGIVTAGAAAALMVGAAACMARLDPAAMNRLPDSAGLAHEFIVSRSQRNMYDRSLRIAGGLIIEIGIPDRLSGPGVRDASAGELAEAITPRTAAVFHLAGENAEPPLTDVVRVAHARGVPVLVDAAAQLPPAENLRRFIAEGADLVCFSGGKAIGGPQASGILAGRRDLVSSALAQMLDLDLPDAQFVAPPEFAPLNQLRYLPHHGIGRVAKVGKEEIVGLVTALRHFAAESPAARSARWMARLAALQAAVPRATLMPDGAKPGLTLLEIRFPDRIAAERADAALRAWVPAIHLDASRIRRGVLAVNPIALDDNDLPALAAALKECCA